MSERREEIVCREFVELTTSYLDDALAPAMVDLVEEHLVMCDWCRTYLDQMEATSRVVAAAHRAPPPVEVLDDLMAAFRAAGIGG
jgi:predicted anti-sigma-YlaC factor YlaD